MKMFIFGTQDGLKAALDVKICHKCSLLAFHCFLTKKMEKKCYYFKTGRNLVYFFPSSIYIAFSILDFSYLQEKILNKMF